MQENISTVKVYTWNGNRIEYLYGMHAIFNNYDELKHLQLSIVVMRSPNATIELEWPYWNWLIQQCTDLRRDKL